ncbi:hypothetical protein AB1N83_014189 [Pleurotus pulmonarius]
MFASLYFCALATDVLLHLFFIRRLTSDSTHIQTSQTCTYANYSPTSILTDAQPFCAHASTQSVSISLWLGNDPGNLTRRSSSLRGLDTVFRASPSCSLGFRRGDSSRSNETDGRDF